MPSRAMACNSRGAPVRLWSPAPQQEKNEPITMTQGDGQARIPITGVFFIEWPSLKHPKACICSTWYISQLLHFHSSYITINHEILISNLFWHQTPENHEPGRLQKVNKKVTKTYLSLSTTPSIQAPNRTTQEMSEHEVKTKCPSTECTLTTHMFAQLHSYTWAHWFILYWVSIAHTGYKWKRWWE